MVATLDLAMGKELENLTPANIRCLYGILNLPNCLKGKANIIARLLVVPEDGHRRGDSTILKLGRKRNIKGKLLQVSMKEFHFAKSESLLYNSCIT